VVPVTDRLRVGIDESRHQKQLRQKFEDAQEHIPENVMFDPLTYSLGNLKEEQIVLCLSVLSDRGPIQLLQAFVEGGTCAFWQSRPWKGETCGDYQSHVQGVKMPSCRHCEAVELLKHLGLPAGDR